MNRFLPILAGALALSWAISAAAQSKPPKPNKPAPSAAAAKKLYCWNENGRKICGDALPASAVDSERTELSGRSGLRTGSVDRALNDSERAQHEAEQKRMAAEAEAAETAKRRDLALVASYTSEEELRRAYRIRYDLIDEAIKSSRLALDNLHQSLLRMLEQAGENELSGRPISKPLADNIRARRTSYLDLRAGYQQQERERAAIDQQLQEAVARYREMKSAEPGAAATDGGTQS